MREVHLETNRVPPEAILSPRDFKKVSGLKVPSWWVQDDAGVWNKVSLRVRS